MASDKIYNFIIALFIGVLIVYLNNVPPTVIIRNIPKKNKNNNDNKNDKINDMCYSYEYRGE
jgi:hypothetical protein